MNQYSQHICIGYIKHSEMIHSLSYVGTIRMVDIFDEFTSKIAQITHIAHTNIQKGSGCIYESINICLYSLLNSKVFLQNSYQTVLNYIIGQCNAHIKYTKTKQQLNIVIYAGINKEEKLCRVRKLVCVS